MGPHWLRLQCSYEAARTIPNAAKYPIAGKRRSQKKKRTKAPRFEVGSAWLPASCGAVSCVELDSVVMMTPFCRRADAYAYSVSPPRMGLELKVEEAARILHADERVKSDQSQADRPGGSGLPEETKRADLFV